VGDCELDSHRFVMQGESGTTMTLTIEFNGSSSMKSNLENSNVAHSKHSIPT